MEMTLDEAMNILEEDTDGFNVVSLENRYGAEKLGIEAIKRELLFRSRVPRKEWSLLPGETEEK